jgi:serine/threonine-protein kinase
MREESTGKGTGSGAGTNRRDQWQGLVGKPMIDKLLNYTLLEVLGKGAGSTIYRGRDNATGRIVAIKHVVRDKPKDLRFVEQMETEYEVSRVFSHPNLRRSFDLKVSKSLFVKVTEAVLVMEYIDALPLERGLPPDLGQVIQTFVDAAKGLQAMHRGGWAHCDIKPNNILRADDGTVKVIDFGQSCRIGTVKERIQGTPDYIAPEQVDRLPIAETTDVFNLGATLYWATTGKHIPTSYHAKRKGENSFVLDSLFKTPRELNPEVPQPVSEVIMQCVATSQRKRPQSMDEVIRKLELGRHIMDRNESELTRQADEDPLVNDTKY